VRDAIDEVAQDRLALGVDPLQVLDHDDQRMLLGLGHEHLVDRLQGAPAALRGRQGEERVVVWQTAEQAQHRGHPVVGAGAAEGRELPADRVTHDARVVVRAHAEDAREEPDDRQVGKAPAMGDALGHQHPGLAIQHVAELQRREVWWEWLRRILG